MKYKQRKHLGLRHILSTPFIWGILIPFVMFDIVLELYHNIVFRLYDIELVNRKNYIKIDRYKLKHLTTLDKINCAYCGYINGLFAYAVAIGAETEKYWCAIQHQQDSRFVAPAHHTEFMEYDDEDSYRKLDNYQKGNE